MSENKPITKERKINTFISILDIWRFRLVTGVMLAAPLLLLQRLLYSVISSSGTAITTANLGELVSWRLPCLLVIGIAIIICYLAVELLAQIHLCNDIVLSRRPNVFVELGRGFRSSLRLFNGFGVLAIVFVAFLVPLTGVGFSISLTRDFYIPTFISSVIHSNPYMSVPYLIFLVLIVISSGFFIFTFHGVVIDKMKPRASINQSFRLVRTNWKKYVTGLIKVAVFSLVVYLIAVAVFNIIPATFISSWGENLPTGYKLPPETIANGKMTDTDIMIFIHRFFCNIQFMLSYYLVYMVMSMLSCNFMLKITAMYYDFTGRPVKPGIKKMPARKMVLNIVLFVLIITLFAFTSFVIAAMFDVINSASPTQVIVHRTGGITASENSLEGIDKAVNYKCYGCETDIQRTSDGHYIINHDGTFGRLTGVNRKPSDMTLDEIRQLRIADTTGNGKTLSVPTLEEVLDKGKGRIKLFLELKGPTADNQMVDDVVKMVRERDMVSDVTLISLDYNVINYAESTYPEFETGVLIFSGLGDLEKLNADIIIMEEEMCSPLSIIALTEAGKKSGVWTINSDYEMYMYMNMGPDYIITDDPKMANEAKAELKDRSDYIIIYDMYQQFVG